MNDEELKEAQIKADEYNYMLLSRLESDIKYFLGFGNRNEKHLWTGNIDYQFEEMKRLHSSIIHKPEWLFMDEILEYEKQVKA